MISKQLDTENPAERGSSGGWPAFLPSPASLVGLAVTLVVLLVVVPETASA